MPCGDDKTKLIHFKQFSRTKCSILNVALLAFASLLLILDKA